MSAGLRWALVLAAVALVVGLLVWARGDTHRRGDEIGSLPAGGPVASARLVPDG